MSDPGTVDPIDNTRGWRDHVRHPVATKSTERTSGEPAGLAQEQDDWNALYRPKAD